MAVVVAVGGYVGFAFLLGLILGYAAGRGGEDRDKPAGGRR